MSKVKFGLKNLHYTVVTETTNETTGVTTSSYGTVKPWKGLVNLSLDPQGDSTDFWADDGLYYEADNNTGYSGALEVAYVPDDIYSDVYGQAKDANDVYTETNADVQRYIALLFEFTEDASARRFALYRVKLSRNSLASGTKGETVEVKTETLNLKATPRPDDGRIKAWVNKSNSAAYASWYSAVYVGSTPQPAISVPESITLAEGETATLTASVVPAGTTVTWTSADTGVATVGETTGVVNAVDSGNTIITASITVSGVVYTATTTVIVTA